MKFSLNISFWLVLWLLLLAGGVFVLFALLRGYFLPVVKGRKDRQKWQKRLLQLEITAWLALVLYGGYSLMQEAPLVVAIGSLITIVLGWQWWQDFFPGLLFRLEQYVEHGDHLIINDEPLEITAIRPLYLEMKNEQEQRRIMPFRMVREITIEKAAEATALRAFSFLVTTPLTAAEIMTILIECPWTAPGRTPKVRSAGNDQFTVTVFAPSEVVYDKQKVYLLARLAEM